MTKIKTARLRKGALLAAVALGLTACTDADVARILAENPGIDESDFIGQTFPVYFGRAEQTDGSPLLESGTASVTFNSRSEFVLRVPGEEVLTFTRVGMSEDFEATDSDGFTITVTVRNFGDYGVGFIPETGGIGAAAAFEGYFGFETPVEQRPAFADYDQDDFSAVFVSTTENSEFAAIFCEGCVDLAANFITGDIDGTLFDGEFVEGDSSLAIVNTLDGTITNTGYTGTVTTDITLIEDGDDPISIEAELEDQSFQGVFFGTDAESTAFVYDGELNGGDISIEMSGAGDASDAGGASPE